MKTVIINLKEDEIYSSKKISIKPIIRINSSFVDITNYIKEDELNLLILLEHQQPITKLNLTDVTPYVILFFDDELNFKGASHSIKSGDGNFTIQTQYKTILLMRIPHNIKLKNIISLNNRL